MPDSIKRSSKMTLSSRLEAAWYRRAWWLVLLLPFSFIYTIITVLRRKLYDWGVFKRHAFDTPVVVVGNILTGGTGKTPIVIELVKQLQKRGLKVGVVSRGYRNADEAQLIADETRVPVVTDKNRVRAVERIIASHHPDIIIADDGLQHYALKPSFTIVVHPNQSFFHALLPAGPLREPLSRLSSFDCCLSDVTTLVTDNLSAEAIQGTLVTGIARPWRVLDALKAAGFKGEHLVFPDHHDFVISDFDGLTPPILMTQKDWVKCKGLAMLPQVMVLQTKTVIPERVVDSLVFMN